MRRIAAFLLLASIKGLSHAFFRSRFEWTPPRPEIRWEDLRLLIFLHHTSLYEPIFITGLPWRLLWRIAGHGSIPGADSTLSRPIVGRFWKLLLPRLIPITRKRDESWSLFLDSIRPADLVLIAPEGRMKRPDGLDKHGKPMSVRGGVADILERMDGGEMMICVSGGLHHVQAPGEWFPRPFQEIEMSVTVLPIRDYKASLTATDPKERKIQIIQDLEARIRKATQK